MNNKQYGQYMFLTPVLLDTVGAENKVELNRKQNIAVPTNRIGMHFFFFSFLLDIWTCYFPI